MAVKIKGGANRFGKGFDGDIFAMQGPIDIMEMMHADLPGVLWPSPHRLHRNA
jgi:hypothetical protein